MSTTPIDKFTASILSRIHPDEGGRAAKLAKAERARSAAASCGFDLPRSVAEAIGRAEADYERERMKRLRSRIGLLRDDLLAESDRAVANDPLEAQYHGEAAE